MLHCRIFGFLLDWRQSGLILLAFVAMPSPQTISSSLRCRRLLLFPNFRRESIFLVYPTESGRRRFLHRLRDDDDGRRVFFDQKKKCTRKEENPFFHANRGCGDRPVIGPSCRVPYLGMEGEACACSVPGIRRLLSPSVVRQSQSRGRGEEERGPSGIQHRGGGGGGGGGGGSISKLLSGTMPSFPSPPLCTLSLCHGSFFGPGKGIKVGMGVGKCHLVICWAGDRGENRVPGR